MERHLAQEVDRHFTGFVDGGHGGGGVEQGITLLDDHPVIVEHRAKLF